MNLHFISTVSSISLFLFTSIAHLISGSPDVQLARRPCLECEMIKQVKWNFFFGQSFSWILSGVKQPFKLLSKMLSHYMFCRVTRWRLAGRVEFVEFFYDFIFWEPVNIVQFGSYWEPVSGSRRVFSILPFCQPFLWAEVQF